MLSVHWLFFCQLLIVATVICDNRDNLIVKTDSGAVQGVALTSFFTNKEFIAYRGIPYAKPPIGDLRFKAPVPIAPWRRTLLAEDYQNACLVIAQSQLFPLNTTQSEDCLYLNVFTPVMESKKINSKKAVMFFIHGGAFTEGDGTDGFYGPDFIVEDDVILVTFDYRLGPWGFASFDLKGYTGNMGFKDQQLALEWVKRNIKYFGGDPNRITVFGESAGAVSVHLHLLSDRSRKSMKRAIAMSGSALGSYTHYQPNNHIELFKKIFELDAEATGQDVLQFMLNAPVELILQKAPVLNFNRGIVELFFTAVIEDVEKAESPFLTRGPREIYKKTNVNVDAMFGVTTTEYMLFVNPADPYSWIEPMKNNFSNIGLPLSGLTLSPESPEYQEAIKKIHSFYFGERELTPTLENLNIYLRMFTDMSFVYPVYESLKLHSVRAETFCYENDLDLNLNAFKIMNHLEYLDGMGHFEDLHYLFLSKKYTHLYAAVLANPDDPKNKKTIKALNFLTKMFTDYAKNGSPGKVRRFSRQRNNCIGISNDGLESMDGLRAEAMTFLDQVYKSVERWIVNPF